MQKKYIGIDIKPTNTKIKWRNTKDTDHAKIEGQQISRETESKRIGSSLNEEGIRVKT